MANNHSYLRKIREKPNVELEKIVRKYESFPINLFFRKIKSCWAFDFGLAEYNMAKYTLEERAGLVD
tara:strand:+ start:437 stop:637 length:201 start_codon:yes stop_codon:yes gene_type:complete